MVTDIDLRRNICELLHGQLNKTARDIQQIRAGRNSRVFRVTCAEGDVFAVKAYFTSETDRRDRLGCEFGALSFLKNEGVAEVATPLVADKKRKIAVYEFVQGHALKANDIGEAEIAQAVEFLGVLKTIADSGRADSFPPASEACFSIAAILENLNSRLGPLTTAAVKQPALADFLYKELEPIRRLATNKCHEFCWQHQIPIEAEIPVSERTLSPSDFGFHNALRRSDGRIVFLDFEYFGWDDPAKTVADFLLHPAMELSHQMKRQFLAGIQTVFNAVPGLVRRLCAVYPLFVIKWCLILLNEFTLEGQARRCFALGAQGAWDEAVQLEKARRMLAQIEHDYCDLFGIT